jgi:hypothetical protein
MYAYIQYTYTYVCTLYNRKREGGREGWMEREGGREGFGYIYYMYIIYEYAMCMDTHCVICIVYKRGGGKM